MSGCDDCVALQAQVDELKVEINHQHGCTRHYLERSDNLVAERNTAQAKAERLQKLISSADGYAATKELLKQEDKHLARINLALRRMSPLIAVTSGDMKDEQLVEVSAGFIRLLVSALEGDKT